MNKFAQISVIEFKNGKTAESFESDNDFRSGSYGRELAGKVRITWDDDGSVEWVKSDSLHKMDKTTYILTRVPSVAELEDLLKPVYSTEVDPNAVNVHDVIKASKTPRKRTSPAKKDES